MPCVKINFFYYFCRHVNRSVCPSDVSVVVGNVNETLCMQAGAANEYLSEPLQTYQPIKPGSSNGPPQVKYVHGRGGGGGWLVYMSRVCFEWL